MMPQPHIDSSIPVDKNYIHYLGSRASVPGKTDARSITPAGFAKAVFLANH